MFNNYFGIADPNAEHLDIPLLQDLEQFVDPFLIRGHLDDRFTSKVHVRGKLFFEHLLTRYVIPKDEAGSAKFLEGHLGEAKSYHLGYSEYSYLGHGIGKGKSVNLFKSLSTHQFAVKNLSLLHDPFYILLLVDKVGCDNLSDVILSVCRDLFSEFTEKQCIKYGIPMQKHTIDFFSHVHMAWDSKIVNLPFYNGEPIILVPKWIVSRPKAYTEDYKRSTCKEFVWPDLIKNELEFPIDSSLYTQTRDGERKPNIKALMRSINRPKKKLHELVLRYPNSIEVFFERRRKTYSSKRK